MSANCERHPTGPQCPVTGAPRTLADLAFVLRAGNLSLSEATTASAKDIDSMVGIGSPGLTARRPSFKNAFGTHDSKTFYDSLKINTTATGAQLKVLAVFQYE